MKLTPWQMIAAFTALCAAVILSHIFAPGAVPMVVSIVTTALALLLQRKDPPPPSDGGGPTLRVIPGGASEPSQGVARTALAVGCALVLAGCWWHDPNPPVTDALEKCRNEARDAFYADASAADATTVYERCKARMGIL
jgi:hypothetical protein